MHRLQLSVLLTRRSARCALARAFSHPGTLWFSIAALACVACMSEEPRESPPEVSSVTSAATVAADFSEGPYVTGLLNPTTMAFAPDGRLFVCEQAGRLRVIDEGGVLLPTPFLTVSSPTAGEQGLVGITFDPNFESNRFVYVYYTMTTPTQHNRLSRFTANGNVAVPGSEVIIYEGGTTQSTIHNGGALHFGTDGKLYVAVGEDATGTRSQELSNTWGKILRFNADGTIPSDNPFFASTTGTNRAIWALGLRNPFTFDIERTSGRMFINDVGQDSWEEINDGVAGANYGWPINEGATSNPLYRGPIYAYAHSGGGDITGCAITGGTFYDPQTAQFPSSYVGDYFYADYCSNWIRRLDVNGATVTSHAFLQAALSPVDIDVGPDGTLFYLNRGDGSVHRVTYAPAGAPPAILSQPANITVAPGQAATFTVGTTGSSPLSFQWQREGVNIAGATGASYTLASAALGDNGADLRVIVTNPFGTVTSNAAVLTVTTDLAPTVSIVSPIAGTLYSGGQVISYAGTADDPEDGPLPGTAFTWRVIFHHDTHTHPFLAGATGNSGTFQIPVIGHVETNVWYRVELSVRDSVGHVVSAFTDIRPTVAPITLVTSPPGMSLSLDGTPRASGYTEPSVAGVRRTLSAPAVQSSSGFLYAFQSWSDGGGQTHEIASPSSATTYTAVYAPVTGGLRGEYFNESNLTSLALTRNDPRVDFDFGEGSPVAGVAAESYSIRWTGTVTPRHSETYRFFTLSDDGIRLWVNNVLLVDNWTNHAPIEDSGTIALNANVPVPIRVEYFNAWGGAVARLSWESTTQLREIVPQQQLREPNSSEPPPPPPPPPGEAPAISTPPASTIVAPGQPATFTVVASGTPALTYQWQRDGAPIAGASAASYTLASAALADSGASFRVVVTNAFGMVTSAAATLTVSSTPNTGNGLRGEYFNELNLTAPVLTRSDASIDFDFGEGSPLAGVAAETYSIRWTGQVVPRFSQTYTFSTLSDDGVRLWVDDVLLVDNWTNHAPTENAGTIALTAGTPVSIRLEYYNIWGGAQIRLFWASTAQAREIVPASQLLLPGSTPLPPTGAAPTISTPPANVNVAPGQAASFSVIAAGSAPLSYQWQRDGTNIPGATSASYTLASPTVADSGAAFRVVVSNAIGSVTSAAATLTVTVSGTAPTITTAPASVSVASGQAATFSVTAAGTAPLGYQWQRNGTNIPGATGASYTLASPTVADSGAAFRVVVSNAFGSVTSAPAALTVGVSTGSGLRGEYFDEMDLTSLVLTRTDGTINFDFGEASPAADVEAETYSVRWTGQIVPRFSQTYTFTTLSDDGVRLWVNNVQVIDNWTNHAPTENSGTLALTAGVPVSIRLEFYNIWGAAQIRLYWASSSQAREIVPPSQLVPPSGSPPPPPPSTFAVTLNSVSNGKMYAMETVAVGSRVFIDRAYTVSSLSSTLAGARYIRTANDDRNLTTSAHIRFTPNAPATVYVAYDTRGTLPNWLRTGWTLTTLSLVTTDASGTLARRVYRRNYPAGQISLGGNLQSPASGAGVHYTVLIQPQ